LKKALFIVSAALLVLAGCESVGTVAKGAEIVGGITARPGGAAGPVMAGEPDLKPDEVLAAASDDTKVLDADFLAAKILTPASAATKNQAEVIFVDGKKAWSNFILPTHKASNAELKVGMPLLYSAYANDQNLSAENYRLNKWYFGNITSVDELFKGVVEVAGEKKFVKNCRIPNQPVM